MESETIKKKGGKGARAKTLPPIFNMSLSLATSRGVTLPPDSVTPVIFLSNLSIDRHRASYDISEQILGNPLEGIVVPEGVYPAKGRKVRVLVANNGSEGKLLLAEQKLEGLAVSEIQGNIKPPAPKPRAAATQYEPQKEEPLKVSKMTEPPRRNRLSGPHPVQGRSGHAGRLHCPHYGLARPTESQGAEYSVGFLGLLP
ncbi:MAG: hypothetical protein GY696_11340 [Gammaproteobacteria bacterium]|nr:hypothetical protein [Gammaproteobacteria bacterium]